MPETKNKDDFLLAGVYDFFSLKERKPQKQQEKKFLFLSSFFCRLNWKPNFLSCLALFLVILAGGFILRGFPELAGICIAGSWFFTFYDGIYARNTAAESRFGGLFNDLINLLCDFFLLTPLIISAIFSVSYFLALMLLWLLALYITLLFCRSYLADIMKVRKVYGFFGRTELWWLFIIGVLFKLLPLAVMVSAFLLLLAVLQLGYRAVILYASEPRVHPKEKNSRTAKTRKRKTK